MSEVTLATRSRHRAQPIRVQVFFELRTFLSFLTFLNLEWIPLLILIEFNKNFYPIWEFFVRFLYYWTSSSFLRFRYHFSHLKRQDAISKKYFGNDTPYVGDLEKNVSLVLTNTHYTTGVIRPLVPAIIEIGGPPLHLPPVKPLPKVRTLK